MSIDISDNLLKSVQQELLVSLRTVEGQIADLLEFGDVQEIDKILDTLHIVEGALMMLSETMAVTVCNDIYNNIKQIAQDTDAYSKQDELLFAFLTLVQSIQLSHLPISQVALKNVHLLLGNDDEVVQDTSLDISTLFPVSEETIETIAFSVKKELSVTKSLVEENFDNLHDKTVKESLSETLAIPFAVFKLLNYQTGVSLIEQARGLLKNNSIKENIEEFTDNIVLLEDALWQLDSLKKQSEKSNQADSKVIQTQHSRNITSQAAKVIFAKTTYLFFKSLREEVIEKFDNLDSLDMMRLGEEFHSIATTAGIFKEHKLAKLLYGSEQRHLFFCQQKEVIKQPKINKIYLDLIVTYEIIFEELQHSKTIDTYALALIEAAQKQLLSQIDFEPEKVATPDYLYASNDDVLADDIEGDLSAISDHSETLNDSSKDTSLTDTDSLDSVSAEVPSPVAQVTDTHSDTEILDSNVEDISESYQDSQPDSQSENEQSADITSHQFTDDNTDEGSKVEEKGQGTVESIYHQLTDAHNLSINTDINSVSEDDIDEEILEIFIEEGQGIADLLKQETPRLKDNYFDEELIKTLQRAYHTLKGSGKMVGLNVFGEFAWQHENLLNHVVSGECQLNEIALQQFIKAQQLVEETVNTEPFVENKDVLLLAAAQAEVIKDLLLGKISMPELNKLDETPTETEPSTDEVTTDTDVSDTDVQETPIAETPAEEVSVEEELSAT
ncbi:MAG: Hpt domain-containing protein, partial [Gammaproteobacteria bacterium]|nr:Hpt domain-containing protein [Gammaproteobacteria bacterium]